MTNPILKLVVSDREIEIPALNSGLLIQYCADNSIELSENTINIDSLSVEAKRKVLKKFLI